MPAKKLMDYLVIALGSLLLALGLVLFLIPNKIAAGGVSGLATVIFYAFHLRQGKPTTRRSSHQSPATSH